MVLVCACVLYFAVTIWVWCENATYGALGRRYSSLSRELEVLVLRRSSFSAITNRFGKPSVYHGPEAERVARLLAIDKEDAQTKARVSAYTVLFHLDANTTAFVFFDANTNVTAFAVGRQ
jgi:hypothetical protein